MRNTPNVGAWRSHTNNQTFHLFFSQDIHPQLFFQPVVVLVSTSTSSHDTEFISFGAIAFVVLLFQLPDKIDAQVDPMSFEVQEVEPAAIVRRVQLASKIDKLRKCSTNL